MEVVDIYGHIPNGSELVLGVGNYNNIHGLLTYFPAEDLLQMRSLPDIITPSVVQVIVTYEKPLSAVNSDKVYFSLAVKDPVSATVPLQYSDVSVKRHSKYINVNIEVEDGRKVACACISDEKCFFTVDYSSVDRKPRPQLLAGALYSLQTVFGEQTYVVSWKIQGFSNGDLIIFLPTLWYEPQIIRSTDGLTSVSVPTTSFCENKSGIANLIESLNQLQFKGYTTQSWCETATHVTNCVDNNVCGECLGPCRDPKHICYVNPDLNAVPQERFICGMASNEPDMTKSTMVSFANQSSTPQTTGTLATWIALIAIFVLVALLAWGLSRASIAK